ncbi:unnamed protein product, partial [Linum tenue]
MIMNHTRRHIMNLLLLRRRRRQPFCKSSNRLRENLGTLENVLGGSSIGGINRIVL